MKLVTLVGVVWVLLVLASCTQVNVQAENLVEDPTWNMTEEEIIALEENLTEPEQPEVDLDMVAEPRQVVEMTLLRNEPQILTVGDTNYTLMLENIHNDKAIIDFHGVTLVMEEDQIIHSHDYTIELVEAKVDGVITPRQSWVDLSFNKGYESVRTNIIAGEGKIITLGEEEYAVLVDFVGLKNNEPNVRLIVGDESVIMNNDGEHSFESGLYVRVREIYFNDATEFQKTPAARIKVMIQ